MPAAVFAAKAPALVEVQVYPPNINLSTKQDRQTIVVQASYSDGVTRDVTAEAKYTLGNKALVKLDKAVFRPLADGSTDVKVSFGGKSLTVPVKVEKAGVEEPISFSKDVVPAFSKAGCNTGSCHGASRGKDGFRLSLFGYDPDGDFKRVTREQLTRRINLAIPEESLIVEKGAGLVPHTGGQTFKPGDELYATVVRWLQDGALADKEKVASVDHLEIYPKQSVLEGKGAKQQIIVRAVYTDGTDRDVTSLAVFASNNDVAAKVDKVGLVTADARGEAFITARYEAHTVGVQTLVVPKGQQFTFPPVKENNYVDTLVHNKLKKLRILPSEVCDDATFLRRVYLDIIGLLPTPEEVRKFVGDPSTGKRELVVDAEASILAAADSQCR